jgi:ATP-dependent DNA helicase RecQ
MPARPADTARKLLLEGKLAQAEALLRQSNDAWSQVTLADLLLLRAPFDRETVDEAVACYEKALRDLPEIARASIDRARATLKAAPDPLVDRLRDDFGHAAFRPGQRELIQAVLKGRHALGVFPPGAGRSLLYELPARLLEGATVVVSTRPAKGDIRTVAPDSLPDSLAGTRVDLLVIDEAHRVTDRSHEFRPEYQRLRAAIGQIRPAAVLALSCAATTPVRHEIIDKLGLQNPLTCAASFDRPGLFLSVVRAADKSGMLAAAIRETSGSCLVFANRKSDVEEVTSQLRNAGIPAGPYPAADEDWQRGRVRVLVTATDPEVQRPDVHAVFHYQYPASLEQYYLDISRAGRDGQASKAILFFDPADRDFHRSALDEVYPPREAIARVYGLVKEGRAESEASLQTRSALAILEQVHAIRPAGDGRLEIVPDAPPIQRIDLSETERRRRQAEDRLRAVETYVEGRACRRRAILEYFGEQLPSSWTCSGCDRCKTLGTEETKRSPAAREAVLDSVRQLEARRMKLNEMARAILFLGKTVKGLTETDVREILSALIRDGDVELNSQGQWLKARRR